MTGCVSLHLVCPGPSFSFSAIKKLELYENAALEGEDQVCKDLTDGIVTK